jgi:hypothetical protein
MRINSFRKSTTRDSKRIAPDRIFENSLWPRSAHGKPDKTQKMCGKIG